MRVTKDAIRGALAEALSDVKRDDFERAVSAAFAAVGTRPAPPAGWRYFDDEAEADCFGGVDPDSALVRYAGDWLAIVGVTDDGGIWRAELHNPAADAIPPQFWVATSSQRAALTLGRIAAEHAGSIGIGEECLRRRFEALGFEVS